MDELLIRKRWAPWWLGVAAAGLSIFFGWVILQSLGMGANGELGIRIFISMCAVAGYLALAIILNVRMAEVTPKGVRVWVGPVPVGSSVTLDRDEIEICYARHCVAYSKGVELDSFYTSGVQTRKGRQIDITRRISKPEQAYRTAQDIAEVLNRGDRAGRKLESGWVKFNSNDWAWKRQVLAWLLLFLSAVIVGTYWEVQSGGG